MDISEFLKNNRSSSSSGSERGSVDDQYGSRKDAFQQIRKDRFGTQAESRALRASETKERRISERGKKFEKHRGIVPGEVFDENEENKDVNVPKESKGILQPQQQKSRREKLEEYRRQKKLEEEKRKKQAKPAFRVGRVHHPLAPFGAGAHKPVDANRTVIGSSTAQRSNTSVMSNNASRRVNPLLRRATNKLGKTASSIKAEQKKHIPDISVQPPSVSSLRSVTSSTGSVASFAPENFQFQPMDIPTMSTPQDQVSSASKPRNRSDMMIPKYRSTATDSEVSDDVFSGKEDQETERKEEIEPKGSEKENNSNSEDENKVSDSGFASIDDIQSKPQTSGRPSRSRSRRISGVQPDPSIPQEELAKTPAKAVKERSLSSTRRSKMNFCCDSPGCEHYQGAGERSEGPRLGTPVRTPRVSRVSRKSVLPVVSESSSSPGEGTEVSPEQIQPKEIMGRRKSSRLSSRGERSDMSVSEEKEVEVAKQTPRRSSMIAPVFTDLSSTEEEEEDKSQVTSGESSTLRDRPEPMDVEPGVKSTRPRRSTRRSSARAAAINTDAVDSHTPADDNIAKKSATTSDKSGNDDMKDAEAGIHAPSAIIKEIHAAESAADEKPSTPTTNTDATTPDGAKFKTPLPIKQARSARRFPASQSPYVDDRRSSSKKRKYSLSETKQKSSFQSLFDDIPNDEDSPIMHMLKKKFRSSDHVDSLEVENILSQFKAQRLSDQFSTYSQENDDVFDEMKSSEKPSSQEETMAEHVDGKAEKAVAEADKAADKADKTADKADKADDEADKAATEAGEEVIAHARSVEGQEDSEHDVPYFRKLLESETQRITNLCFSWETKISTSVPDDVQGQIRSTVGQGRLIMAERFKQFSGLVDNCEFGTGEKTTSCMDLQGFWEMIYFQVEDVDKKFDELKKIEENDWKEVEIVPVRAVKKKSSSKPAVKKPVVSGLRAHIQAMKKKNSKTGSTDEEPPANRKPSIRDMIAAKRAAMKEKPVEQIAVPIIVESEPMNTEETGELERTFDGGFFQISSPARSDSMLTRSEEPASKSPRTDQTPRGSKSTGGDRLRRSVLTDTAKRKSGLLSPFISQMAKRSLERESADSTPMRSARRASLFSDMDDDEPESTEVQGQPEDTKVTENLVSPTHVVDPVVPLCSPVTKTYSKNVTHTEHEQKMDAAFDMLVSTPGERELDGTPQSTLKSAGGKRKKRGSQSVKFSVCKESDSVGGSVVSTPHPQSRRNSVQYKESEESTPTGSPSTIPVPRPRRSRLQPQQDENTDPNKNASTTPGKQKVSDEDLESTKSIKSRVSLLPGMDVSPETVTDLGLTSDLMTFSPMPTRRSTRLSSAHKLK